MDKRKIKIIVFLVLVLFIGVILFVTISRKLQNRNTSAQEDLTCEMRLKQNYKVTYTTNFKDHHVNKITVTYVDENTYSNEYASFSNQIDYLCGLKGSTFKYINNDLIIILDKQVLNSNKNDKVVKNMFQEYESLKIYYEKLGYNCT